MRSNGRAFQPRTSRISSCRFLLLNSYFPLFFFLPPPVAPSCLPCRSSTKASHAIAPRRRKPRRRRLLPTDHQSLITEHPLAASLRLHSPWRITALNLAL